MTLGRLLEWGQAPKPPGFVALARHYAVRQAEPDNTTDIPLNMVNCGLGQMLKFVKGLGKLLQSLQFMAWMNCGLDHG